VTACASFVNEIKCWPAQQPTNLLRGRNAEKAARRSNASGYRSGPARTPSAEPVGRNTLLCASEFSHSLEQAYAWFCPPRHFVLQIDEQHPHCAASWLVLRGADEAFPAFAYLRLRGRGHFRDESRRVAVHDPHAQHEVLNQLHAGANHIAPFHVALSCDEHLLPASLCSAQRCFVLFKRSTV